MSRHRSDFPRFRVAILRVVGFGIAVLSASGLVFLNAPTLSQIATAAPDAGAITVRWNGDQSVAKSFQPVRDESSPHYAEFKNISVSVSQTKNLSDQAIRVDIAGFAGTREQTDFGGQTWSTAMNFMQAMQCWGSDPLAVDFVQTCQWGGRYAPNNGLGFTVFADNTPRLAITDVSPFNPTVADNGFLTVQKKLVSAKQKFVTVNGNREVSYPLLDYFNPATTNEVQSARINGDGTGYFPFETQSADQAPQLGCGSEGTTRCWLVLVPRGTIYDFNGTDGTRCSEILDNNYDYYSKGRPGSIQAGSPVNPACGYWKNRINIPLDFDPTGAQCAPGAAERRTIGSQLLVGAMSSWQSSLCENLKAAFSFSTNPDVIARLQLLEGKAGAAFTSWPLTTDDLEFDFEKERLKETQLSYAPVAISAPVLAFVAENAEGRIESLKLSPRIVAKLLTQSYRFTVPNNSSDPDKNFAHLPAVNRTYNLLSDDPDFRELNPNYSQFTMNPAIVMPGPSGADAIRQVWRWLLADDNARAWLDGASDGHGMTVNPYYLPRGAAGSKVPVFELTGPSQGEYKRDASGAIEMRDVGLVKLDGTPLKLSADPTDSFFKSDESEVPIKLGVEKYRFDSLQYAPYAESLLSAARDTLRADSHSKTVWDPQRVNAAGEIGDWVSPGAQTPGQRFMISITDAASAARFGLTSIAVQRPNSTDFVLPTASAMSVALGAIGATSVPSVRQVDPSKVAQGGYPLTTVIYAAVNLTANDSAARASYASMIEQITTKGQIPGTQRGELPLGYVPLSGDLAAQAKGAVAAIKSWTSPTSAPKSGPAQDGYNPGFSQGTDSGGDQSAGGSTGIKEVVLAEAGSDRTPGIGESASIGRAGLAVSLGLGLAGALFAPVLLRGRKLLGSPIFQSAAAPADGNPPTEPQS